jgi:hypothetical protein
MLQTSYEVRVSGVVPDKAFAEFNLFRVTTCVSTVLSGQVSDQSALLGMLARLRALGMDVVEVRRILLSEQPIQTDEGRAHGSRGSPQTPSDDMDTKLAPRSLVACNEQGVLADSDFDCKRTGSSTPDRWCGLSLYPERGSS